MGKLRQLFFIGFISFLLVSCAQVQAPTGGEKDEDPPEIEKLVPESGSTNFNNKTITLSFNEFVKLNKLKDQLIVSPPLKYDLKTRIKGKTLEISIEDTLLPNTTYVLNFGNAIVDIAENNPIPDFQYVFSTGDQIDSLQLDGTVKDAFSLELAEKVLVMLYEEPFNDSTPIKQLPTYISRTDEYGRYSITNIKEGNYKLFALQDANTNYLFDRPDEKVAYVSDTLQIAGPINPRDLYLFEHDNRLQYILKQEDSDARLKLQFNLPIDSLRYEILDTNMQDILYLLQRNEAKDSLQFWWKEMEDHRFKMAIYADSNFADTIKFKVDSFPRPNKLISFTNLSSPKNYFEPIRIKFNKPLKKIDTSKVELLNEDSIPIPFQINIDSSDQKVAILKYVYVKEKIHRFLALPAAFQDIYGLENDSISSLLTINKEEDFGKLMLTIKSGDSTSAKIVQLVNSLGNSKEAYTSNNEVIFDHLKEGTYSLKMIIDENADRVWTSGDYLKGKQAEKVIILNEKIQIRKNWDKEIDWIIE